MDAAESDKTLFYTLVKKQRRTGLGSAQQMIFDGELVQGPDLPDAWANYFENLATPADYPEYDEEHYDSVVLQVNMTANINRLTEDPIQQIAPSEVENIVEKLKLGKATDLFGLASEHLRHAHPKLNDVLAAVMTKIVQTATVPQPLKMGVITPVFKKKKNILDPDNYRRITVTPVVGKVMEKLIVEPLKATLKPQINKLQRGFCDQSSSANTAFLFTEAIPSSREAAQHCVYCAEQHVEISPTSYFTAQSSSRLESPISRR
jgi:hypothetical protein